MKKQKEEFEKIIHGESFFDRIMMNDNEFISVAVRRKDGDIEEIVEKKESFIKKHPAFNVFVIRGIINFFEGSANQFYVEKKTSENTEKTNDKLAAYLFFSFIIITGMVIYFVVPAFVAFFLRDIINNPLILGLIEGTLRFLIFITLFFMIVLFERNSGTAYYHGAEHKILWCFNNEDDLTLENAKKYSTLYPACGTGLIFYMVIFSIPIFLFFGYENIFHRILLILVCLPFLVGISFEMSLWLEKKRSKLAKIFSYPVLFLQKFNTKEPKEEHLEIALVAIKNLIKLRDGNNEY